jgi:hypothetical protein
VEHDRDPVGRAAFERGADALMTVHSCPPGRAVPVLPDDRMLPFKKQAALEILASGPGLWKDRKRERSP